MGHRIAAPELAHVGLTGSEVRARGVSYRIAQMPMAMVLRTHTLSQTRGFMKALVGTDDCLLGFTALGAEASELMAVAQTAMLGGIPYTILRDAIWTHPTEAEGLLGLFANSPAPPWWVSRFPGGFGERLFAALLNGICPVLEWEGTLMRAILRKQFGGPDVLEIREIPEPEPKMGHAVIQVKAFGINHAEMHMRKGEWAEIADVSGIECVGVVKSCPGGEFAVGTKVAALMGGLGRTINGSYAEYTCAPVTNIAAIESDLPWAELAVLPETYATAWTCLFRNLEIAQGQTLVIRGATSSFGQAALNMAVNAGVKVMATTRNRERFPMLEALGASRVEIEGPDLSRQIAEAGKLDAVLDLVGNSTILDSLAMLRRGGRACLAGWLGGLAPIHDFNPLLQMASGVYLTFFGSFVFGTPGFPLSDVPLQAIAADIAAGRYPAKPSRVFRFEDIREAHQVMDANQARGKMVAVI